MPRADTSRAWTEGKRKYRSPVDRHHYEHRTTGERIAGRVTASFGS